MRNIRVIRSPGIGGFFSLIELLVVISIISILASLLLPVLSRAREMAASAKCTNNLRQCAMGVISYADDFGGNSPAMHTGTSIWVPYFCGTTTAKNKYIPAFSTGGAYSAGTASTWKNTYAVYRRHVGILGCPLQTEPKEYVIDYGMNMFCAEYAGARFVAADSSSYYGYWKMHRVKKPSSMILFGEPNNSYYVAYNNYTGGQGAVFRHSNGIAMNAVHLDGHVAGYTRNNLFLQMPAAERP